MNPRILHADVVIPMTADNAVLSNGGVLIDADGCIQAVGEAQALIAANPGVPVKRLTDRLL
ncbi:MAG: amidohydrolase, partial [Chloroflexi bacterium]|nr:amidohydrolase [Chloroflexota bacterium]